MPLPELECLPPPVSDPESWLPLLLPELEVCVIPELELWLLPLPELKVWPLLGLKLWLPPKLELCDE